MTNRFEILATTLVDLAVILRQPLVDERGFLERMFCTQELHELLPNCEIKQINRTLTRKMGTVRGMHFQRPPHAEKKLVSCLRGKVFDVAVDLRDGSPTYLRWHAEILSEDNRRTLCIPEGFAHGFQTLTSDCELLYFHTASYEPTAEGAINAMEPAVGIQWPQPIAERSQRDESHRFIDSTFKPILL